jgi:rhamnose transport system permease protein
MRQFVRRYSGELLLVGLIVLGAVWSSSLSPYFLDPVNLLSSAATFVIFALMAFGLYPVVVQGEIDISLPSTLAVGSVLLGEASVAGVPLALALPLVLLVCAGLGALNGYLVAAVGLPSLAVTLGTLGAYRGLAYIIAGDAGVVGITREYTALGSTWIGIVPASVVLALAVAAGFALLMSATSFGRYSFAIGNNAAASRMGGVPVVRTRIVAYALAGAMSGLAGLVWVAQYQSARGDNADGAILFVLTAVVLGGVSIKGGSGRVSGVLLALILLATLQTGMQLANVPGTSQTLVIGCLLVVSLGLPRAIALFRGRRRTPVPRRTDPPPGPDGPTPAVLEQQRG